jgi:membrane associated rhomboid family serine protease
MRGTDGIIFMPDKPAANNKCYLSGLNYTSVITYIIMGITIAISFLAWKKTELFGKLMMNPYAISHKKQYYRFITSGLIHKDHMHLLLNMFSFYFFGLAIERVFAEIFGDLGGVYYVVLFVAAIVVSDLPTYFKHRNNPGYNSLGASGAVSAVVFAYIIFQPLQLICIYIALCMPGFIMGSLYIAFSYYQGRKANDNINHDAHLYGALFGLVFCVILYPSCIPQFIEQIKHWEFLKNIF